MSRRVRLIAILTIIGLFVLSFTQITSRSESYKTLKDYYAQELNWRSCYDNYQCATFAVPVDYSDLSVGTFHISALRFQAQNPKKRIGSLIVNPGGPGASGVEYAYNAEYLFDPDITDRYDIVGFDPRGVSDSEPIVCMSSKELDENFAADSKPDNSAELAQSIKDSHDFIRKCQKKNAHLEAYSTANAARDMDILRELVGDKKLNYMGKSYGTYMGALYASLFPTKIGRVVLDGALDPSISNLDQTINQAQGFEKALNAFIADCITSSSCPLPKNLKDARQSFIDLFAATAKKPLILKKGSKDKRVVTESLVVLGTASALYDSGDGWTMLKSALREARAGYGDTYLELADIYTGRASDGSYPNNEFESGAIIGCLDFAESRDLATMKKDAALVAEASPIFGPYLGYGGLTCRNLPAVHPTEVGVVKTSAPIIIIGTTGDPATPYAWAKGLHRVLTNSQLMTFVGDGHTGQGRGNACIDSAIDAYFLKGTLPKADLTCKALG
jgi:pimeloyl-ACP methyl ester carboxylesterase